MTKYYLAFIVFVAAFGMANAQNNFSLTADTVRGTFQPDKEEHKIKAYANTELSSLTLQWRILERNMPDGWENSLCDNFQCYFDVKVGDSKVGQPIDATTAMPFEAGINSNQIAGEGKLTVKVFEKDDTLKSDTVTFLWSVPLGVKTINVPQFTIYPNPAKSNINIVFEKAAKNEVQVKIYNLVGQEQRNISTFQNGKSVNIDIRNLNNGTYLIQFISTDGKMTTQRFTKRA